MRICLETIDILNVGFTNMIIYRRHLKLMRNKSNVMISIVLFFVLALVLTGCGGGGGGNNNWGGGNGGDVGGGGGIGRPVTANDYLGTWSWQGSEECEYSVQFTVGPKIEDKDGGSYHSGSVQCDIFNGTVSINGDGTNPSDPSVIDLLIEPHGHSILIKAHKNIAFDNTAKVYLSGELTGPNTISVCALTIQESGGDLFYYHYESSEHDDELLLFIKQP